MTPKKPQKPGHRRGKHVVEIEGAQVFSGHATMYASKTKLGRFYIIVDTQSPSGAETEKK